MSPTDSQDQNLTRLLQAWHSGDSSALETLTPLVYQELHRLARRHMAGEREGHLMQPSALVNEAFLRLTNHNQIEWANRSQFFAVSARLMRQILIDFARGQSSQKRGKGAPKIRLSLISDLPAPDTVDPTDLLDLDHALTRLAALDSRQAQVVELRFFGGLANSEIAQHLGISEQTVIRDWRLARAWLFDALSPK